MPPSNKYQDARRNPQQKQAEAGIGCEFVDRISLIMVDLPQ